MAEPVARDGDELRDRVDVGQNIQSHLRLLGMTFDHLAQAVLRRGQHQRDIGQVGELDVPAFEGARLVRRPAGGGPIRTNSSSTRPR